MLLLTTKGMPHEESKCTITFDLDTDIKRSKLK